MRFFSKRYLKAPMALLVCLVMVLQLLPAPQPAYAGFWDIVKKIVSRIPTPPNITFTNEGVIKADVGWADFSVSPFKDASGKPYNPLNKISLGGGSLPLINATTGQPAVVRPIIPEECELAIKYPGDDLCAANCDEKKNAALRDACRELCNQEKIAHREACTHYIRLQKAAADIAFLAKKIYNSTNPLDDCFFLKNCKSNCLLRYGEVKYVITWLDIAQFLLPTAWITVVKQVMGVIAAIGQIEKAYKSLSSLLTDGLTLISGFFDTFNYLKTMFVALENIGGTMSAGLGVASVAASALDQTGILPIPGNAAQFGAVAGAATVLSANSKGVNAMQGMLKRFSDNLLNYSTAKSETNKLLLGMRQGLLDVMEGNDKTKGAKNEIELAFFFEPNNPVRKDLDNLVGNFQTSFKSLASLLDSAIGPGNLPTGPITELTGATDDDYWIPDPKNPQENIPVVTIIGFGKGFAGGFGIEGTAFANGLRLVKDKKDFCQGITQGNYSDDRTQICLFQDDRLVPWSGTTCPPGSALSDRLERLRQLTEPAHIKEILGEALSGACPYKTPEMALSDLPNCCLSLSNHYNSSYCLQRLRDGGEWRRVWAQYWLGLGENILGLDNLAVANLRSEMLKPENVGQTLIKLDEKKDVAVLQTAILTAKDADYSYLTPLAILDDEKGFGSQNKSAGINNYAKEGALSNTEAYLDNTYAAQRLRKAGFFNFCDPAKVSDTNDNPVAWLANFKNIFTGSSQLQAYFGLLDPLYIRDLLIGENSVLACATERGACKLDSTVDGWRAYWEKMAIGLGANISGGHMVDKHLNAIAWCVEKNPALLIFALLDSDYGGILSLKNRGDGDGKGYYNKFDNPTQNILEKGDLAAIQKAIINKLDSADTKPFAFLAPIAGLDDKGYYNAYDRLGIHIRQGVFAVIDKYGAKRGVISKANLDGDPDQYQKVVERTEPAYLKNLLDAALGCGCAFDSNATKVSEEIFCDSTNYDRVACLRDDTFKFAVLDDSKAAWYHFWTGLGEIILDAEPRTDCSKSREDIGTKAFISCKILDYQLALDDARDAGVTPASQELAKTIGGKINAILENITAFTYQRDYLEDAARHTSPPNEREQRARHFSDVYLSQLPTSTRQEMAQKGEEGSDYWQSKFWCADDCSASQPFVGTYDSGIAQYDWSSRTNKVVNSVADLKTIVFGLENGLSAQDPAIIASIEKNAKEFAEAIEKGKLAVDDFAKIRQRDCNRWQYFWQQEHYFKQYGGSYDCDNCKCANRSYLSWPVCDYPTNYWNDPDSYEKNNSCKGKLDAKYCQATPISLGVNSCSAAGNCNGICDCCSNKGNCANQRNILEQAVSPKCYVYIPDCVGAENYKNTSKTTMDNCLASADPCWREKSAWAECLAVKSASECLNQKTAKDYCVAHPCENEINSYNGAVSWAKTCKAQRDAYTKEEIDGADAANKAAGLEYNTLYNFFSIWQGTFGGITDLAKVKDKNPNDYNYYKNKSGYKALKEIEGLVLALQVVWQDDLTTVSAQERLARDLDILGWAECQGNWLSYPTWCDGKLIKHSWYQLDRILTAWQTVRHSSLQSASDSAARPAKDYTASIISSKIIAQEISNKVQMLRFIFEGWPGYPMNSPAVMRDKIAQELAYLPDSQKKILLPIIDEFEIFYNTMKTEVIDSLDKAIGQYIDPGSKAACAEGISDRGFLNRVACFEHCGGLPLEQCLKPDAVIKPHQFEELMQPLSAIENIEDAIFLLTDAELDVNKISSVQESVDNLKPEIQPQNVVSINTNFFNDFNAKVSGTIKGIFNRYNPEKSGGTNCPKGEKCPDNQGPVKTPLSLFNSGDGQPADFKDFANSLADNPLKFLEGQFANIADQFQTIKKRLENTGSWLSQLYNDTRGGEYSRMTYEVAGPKMDELNLKINGNQSLVGACSALGLILQGDIAEMDRTCSQKEDGGELTSQWLSQQLAADKQTTCDIWLALADEVVDAAGIDKEIAALQKQRECVKKDGNGNCTIKCPTWFCSGAGNSDPMCVMCAGVNVPAGCVTRCLDACSDNPAACNRTVCKGSGIALFDVAEFTSQGEREWPPSGVADYMGAKDECVKTQDTMMALKKVKAEIEKAAGKEPQFAPEVLKQLNVDCNELKRQQELKKECDSYGLTKKALANKCNSVALEADKAVCNGKRSQMNGLCAVESGQNWSSRETYCEGTHLADLLARSNEGDLVNEIGLEKVRSRCAQTLDIRTPLAEIMKVLSILMGIQSGTAAHSGLVSSIQGSRVFYENVGKFILMIENLHNAMDTAYDDTIAQTTSGGFKITPFKCVAMPAESSVGGQRLTGPQGGPVCPEVGNIYSQIQADFAAVRQEAASIAQVLHKNKDINVPLPWNNAYVHLFTAQVGDYPSIKPLSDRATELRESAQFVWAMATAINFANANCTCGMSYCKLPFCISGLPLTLAPLKDPYCALVWMLRTPMIDLGNRLAEDLNKKLDKVK